MLVILKLPSSTCILDRGLYFIFGTLINIEFECVPFFSQCACCKAIPCSPQEQPQSFRTGVLQSTHFSPQILFGGRPILTSHLIKHM